jgi:hypothetical protein
MKLHHSNHTIIGSFSIVFIPDDIRGKDEDFLMQTQLTTITANPDWQIYHICTA